MGTSFDLLFMAQTWEGVPFEKGDLQDQRIQKKIRTSVAALHKAGVCHGDVSAGNILHDGEVVRLVDFACFSIATSDGISEDESDLELLLSL